MTPEFNLIDKYFTRPARRALLGVGDDCALLPVAPGVELAVSTDTLVSGVHFFADADARQLGHKALAVNLSDLAAMGASPRFFTLALTLPAIDDAWLEAFSAGLLSLADAEQIELVGGDTTRGPLSMTLTVLGEVAAGKGLRRDGARLGDDIWLSGEVGGASLALMQLQDTQTLSAVQLAAVLSRLHMPMPRVALGRALAGIATSAIDVSDGLLADLGHICERSVLGADVAWDQVPVAAALLAIDAGEQRRHALAGGDDYELCFTAPPSLRDRVLELARPGVPVSRIGTMRAGAGVALLDAAGCALTVPASGFDHFSAVTPASHAS